MKNNLHKWTYLLSLVILSLGCGDKKAGSAYSDSTQILEPVEINQYQGEKLSSWQEFRENSIKGPQRIDPAEYSLEVKGLVNKPLSLSYEELTAWKSYKKVTTLNCVEGWSVKILWEGILVKDLLNEAGIAPGATTVIFRAHDGYSTSMSLAYIMNNDIMMAHRMNEIVLPPERGFPFQLVAEQKWGYKWIKWVTGIELSSDREYKGYWERYGYSNDGDLDKPFFER